MPKGQKTIIWNAEQDAKLFYAILLVQKVDNNLEGVAKAFGKHKSSNYLDPNSRLQVAMSPLPLSNSTFKSFVVRRPAKMVRIL